MATRDITPPPDWFDDDDPADVCRPPTIPYGNSPKDQQARAEKIFKDNVELCAEVIIEIAVNDPNSGRRLSAAKYVVDRVIGTPGSPTGAGLPDAFDALGGIFKEPSAEERAGGHGVRR